MNRSIFLISLILCGIYFYSKNLNNHLILVCLFGLYFVLFQYKNTFENMTTDEALQNISTMYNSGVLKATNLELTGDLKVGGKTILTGIVNANGDLNIKGDLNTGKNLNVEGSTTMKSNLTLNENLKMQDKKILSLGDIGIVYSNLPNKRGEGHFAVFRGSDGHNLIVQQVGIGG